jgi:hypothetical protein
VIEGSDENLNRAAAALTRSAAGRPKDLIDVEFLTRVREALGSG